MKSDFEYKKNTANLSSSSSIAPQISSNFTIQKECEKFNNCTLLEGMTSISALIAGIRDGINTRRIEKIYVDEAKIRSKSKELGFLRAVSGELGFEIEATDASVIDSMTIGTTHGGIIAQ